eukprot:5277278-Amphidinium_carterae.1
MDTKLNKHLTTAVPGLLYYPALGRKMRRSMPPCAHAIRVDAEQSYPVNPNYGHLFPSEDKQMLSLDS